MAYDAEPLWDAGSATVTVSGPWLARSRFRNISARSSAVREWLSEAFTARAATSAVRTPLDPAATQVLGLLAEPLRRPVPAASQAAEAALALAAFSIAERRVLDLADASAGDLHNARLAGDRAVSDWLCREMLGPRSIPATQGPLQSSSFRGGYLAPQVRDDAIRRFVAWHGAPGRTVDDVEVLATALIDELLAQASSLPALPVLAASAMTFTVYRRLRERLLSEGSGGAFEQYLLAGLLGQQAAAARDGSRVVTKSVLANDRAAGTAADIEVRHAQALTAAIEVTASSWTGKLDQLDGVAAAGLSEALIVGTGVAAMSAGTVAELIDPIARRLGLDVAVLELAEVLDGIAARLTPFARAAAFEEVYRCLARWHRREPELAHRLLAALRSVGAIAADSAKSADAAGDPAAPDSPVDDLVSRVQSALAARTCPTDGLESTAPGVLPATLRELADALDGNPGPT